MDPALSFALAEAEATSHPAGREVAVTARLKARTVPGLRIVSRFGDVVSGRVAIGDVAAVWARPEVASLKASQAYAPTVGDDALAEADPAVAPRGVPGARGTGVIVAVLDWGCDFVHSNFRDDQGRTRLLRLWDQRGGQTALSPQRFGYGRELSAEQIDAALAERDPYAALAYDPADSDPQGQGSHGTHVLDIAAGNGRVSGSQAGVAPGADLVFVHLRGDDTGPLGTLGDSARLLEAIDYVLRLAGDRPVVVNCSLGRTAGSHDETPLLVRAMDYALAERKGRAIVCSCGNYRSTAMHASGRVAQGTTVELRWDVLVRHAEMARLDLWYPGTDEIVVELIEPDGRPVASAGPGESGISGVGRVVTAAIFHRRHDPNNGDNQAEVYLWPNAPLGTWRVRLHGRRIAKGGFHAWIERDDPAAQSRFPAAAADPLVTTNSICNGLRTIAVGAYEARLPDAPLLAFSSAGPSRDGRLKPEIAAPGGGIRAACSSLRTFAGRTRDGLTVKSGTSMAAPHVTGTVALMFEAAGSERLAISETRDLLRQASTGGRLDSARTVAAVKKRGQRATLVTEESGMSSVHEWLTGTEATDATTRVRGIDVSHHQGAVDWGAVMAGGIQFAFAKASEGAGYTDPRFAENWAGMRRAGVIRGAYHYLRPEVDAAQQARHFLDVVGPSERGDLAPVVDVEEHSRMSARDIGEVVETWLETVRSQLGREPIVYSGGWFWRRYMEDTTRFAAQPLWISHYTEAAAPRLFGGWTDWTFWQHSDRGTVAGVQGPVDLNRFAGTRSELQALTEALAA